MKVRYTVKIKDGHNAPEFKKGLGKGVVNIEEVEYAGIKSEEDLKSTRYQAYFMEYSRKLLDEWFEVIPEVITVKRERKEKLKQIEENEKEG
jgi:hypothetical protein